MGGVLCSTGALIGRPNGRDYTLLKEFSKRLSCDGFEFMMYSDWYPHEEELTEFLAGLELNIPVIHCQKSIGEAISKGTKEDLADAFSRFEANVRIAKAVGAKKMVVHLWDGITSDSNIDCNIKAYGTLSSIAKPCGVQLLVENVVCNVKDPMRHWCELYRAYPEIRFVFDTKMAAFHNQLELLYEKEYEWLWREDHIRHYHINDYAGGYMDWANLRTLPPGKGHVDFERFFRFVKSTGYDGMYTVEATAFNQEGKVDFDMLNGCFETIREYTKSTE